MSRVNRAELVHQVSVANSTPQPNRHWREGRYIVLDLGHGRTARISPQDYRKVAKFRWTAQRYRNGIYYATAVFLKKDEHGNFYPKSVKTRQQIILMHRLIRDFPEGKVIDHVNPADTLNNTRKNIRVVTNQVNVARRRPSVDPKKTSKYRGVSLVDRKLSEKYKAVLHVGDGRLYLGVFDDPRKAAIAWNRKAIEVWGKGAFQNAV